MTNFPLKLTFLAVLIFLPFLSQGVLACQCYYLPTPYKAYKGSEAVFVGKVVGVADSSGKEVNEQWLSEAGQVARSAHKNDRLLFRFEVQERFKGADAPQISLWTDINMCQFGFDIGSTYLVYAQKAEDGSLETYLFCSRTNDSDRSKGDVHFLRGLIGGKPEPRIYGSVRREDKSSSGDYSYTYLEGITIVADNGKERFTTVTDKNGLYRFDKLPNGKYKVLPTLSDEYKLDWFHVEEITLTDAKLYESLNTDVLKFMGQNAYSEFTVRLNNKDNEK